MRAVIRLQATRIPSRQRGDEGMAAVPDAPVPQIGFEHIGGRQSDGISVTQDLHDDSLIGPLRAEGPAHDDLTVEGADLSDIREVCQSALTELCPAKARRARFVAAAPSVESTTRALGIASSRSAVAPSLKPATGSRVAAALSTPGAFTSGQPARVIAR